jgi:hypothetical protein
MTIEIQGETCTFPPRSQMGAIDARQIGSTTRADGQDKARQCDTQIKHCGTVLNYGRS